MSREKQKPFGKTQGKPFGETQGKKVFVGMSGGVDSSVAAYLLKKQGYDVTGVFMKCWDQENSDALKVGVPCSTAQDAEDARRVAGKLGLPFYVWDFEAEYKKKVVEYMVEGYRKGETPNPDVMCNREIKFGLFLKRALEMGADYVATGHYVCLRSKTTNASESTKKDIKRFVDSDKFVDSNRLYAAKDKNKDQSYFLWTLTQNELKHCLFPIGDYLKSEVRAMARKVGLPTAEKKDSQGICFLGQVELTDFLRMYLPEKRGRVMSLTGQKLGEHIGAQFYTIGQRHGLDLKEKNTALDVHGEHMTQPHYIVSKNIKTNTLVVAEGGNNPALFKKEIYLRDVNFTEDSYISNSREWWNKVGGEKVLARVRYRQPVSRATLIRSGRGVYKLTFSLPQKFVAPGQSAVFYKANPSANSGLRMLGGGVIT